MICSLFRHCYRSKTAADEEESWTIDQSSLVTYSERNTYGDSKRWRPSLYPIFENDGESDHLTAKVLFSCEKSKAKKRKSFRYKFKRACY
ncbi:unnamed protein product [Eruca vesicaria subsp. sativa]|uniref:Uncharacterized protein n=1 Tax=Eruca vesicaria subsp. sativa TaxID=29727 RepID=A0ABC8LET8_ERUVS|nr:unnamed protein product [Eruca vesicaria subsp. sativa]